MSFDLDTLKVSDSQRALSAYIKEQTGKLVKPESVALVETMRVQFRKDPDRVAERTAAQEKARARKAAALEKKIAQAKALAAELGVPFDAANLSQVAEDAEVEAIPAEAEATVTPIRQPAAVPEPEADPQDAEFDDWDEVASPVSVLAGDVDDREDTSAIVVEESQDGWATATASDDEEEDF